MVLLFIIIVCLIHNQYYLWCSQLEVENKCQCYSHSKLHCNLVDNILYIIAVCAFSPSLTLSKVSSQTIAFICNCLWWLTYPTLIVKLIGLWLDATKAHHHHHVIPNRHVINDIKQSVINNHMKLSLIAFSIIRATKKCMNMSFLTKSYSMQIY